jgi:peptidoglycan/LPS O-acetylase OafA/YrhL
MNVASLWFPAIVVVLCLALGAAIVHAAPWFQARLAEQSAHRYAPLDGLRGFLALGVLFVMTTRGWYVHGRWDASFAPFYVVTGQAGVSVFFMITGFLFWSRALQGPIDARALYLSRLRRLTPMYLVSVALALAVIAALSGLVLRTDLLQLARELRPWLSFGFLDAGPVNGVQEAHYVNAVYWTLAFEWSFYLALPLLALFARGRAFVLLAALVLFFGLRTPITLNFLAGALVAAAVENRWLTGRLASPWLAPVPLAALSGVFATDTAYSPSSVALLAVFFAFVADGNTLAGLLRTQAARLLGLVSYSFYLLHGIVIFAAYRILDAALPVASLGAVQHWAVAAVAALFAVALSALTYRYVEHPFLAPRPHAVPEPIGMLHRAGVS